MFQDFIKSTKPLLYGSVLLAVGAANLSAGIITGGFGTTGSGVMTFANAGGTTHFLDWCPTDPTSPAGSTCVGAANYGMGDIAASGGTGTFSGLPTIPGPANGTIKDLTDGNPPTGAYSYLPVGPSTNLDNFITLSLYPTLNFRAFGFVPTTCAPSATQLCAGGFVLNQIGANVFVAISVTGVVFDTATPNLMSTFTDAISGQYNNTSMLAVATAANTTAGVFSNTWSQSIQTTPIPEPGTFFFMGSGFLLLLPLALRRRK
jgi:hypothetical protein